MHRRQFLRTAGSCSLAAALAGCTWLDDGEAAADASATVVELTPPTDPPDVSPEVTESDSDALAIPSTEFTQGGANEFAVEGSVENTSDEAFGELDAEVRLFDANEQEDSLLDRSERTAETEQLPPGETWGFTALFDGLEIGTIDYYAVTARATFAS